MICDRCLSSFVGKIGEGIDETIELVTPENNLFDAENREGFVFLEDNSFDLMPLMSELFWLSWPFRLVCRPDCAGLCPTCGANLNEAPCNCSQSSATRH
jgi:uncharacterized protein